MVQMKSPSQLAEKICSGDEVVIDTSRPTAVLERLADRKELNDIIITLFGNPYSDSTPLPKLTDREDVTIRLSMIPPDMRDLVNKGTVEYVPRTLYQVACRPSLEPERRTVALVQTPSINDSKLHSFGCLSTFGKRLIATADVSIVEANHRVPRPSHCEEIKPSKIDYVVETDRSLPTLSYSESSISDKIAEQVASLAPKGSTIQLGVGGLMRAIGSALADDGPYSIWSGLIGQSTRPLFEADLIEDATACVALGFDQTFYEWISDYDPAKFVSGTISHSPVNLAKQENFIAINSAVQIDLFGQVNAETLGGRQISGVGGQSAFMSAASNDSEGLSIIAIESRAPNEASKIVPVLPKGEIVTTPRYSVDAVVTEYGIARLAGESVKKRAKKLISIAHPGHRSQLRDEADKRGLL